MLEACDADGAGLFRPAHLHALDLFVVSMPERVVLAEGLLVFELKGESLNGSRVTIASSMMALSCN